MSRILLFILAMAVAAPALAQGRPSTTRMRCSAASGLVRRAGAIVLSTGGQTYDRFVASEGFCPTATYAKPAFVRTADNPQCNIGYYCSNSPPTFGW